MPAIFQPRIAKKINKIPSVRVTVICGDHELLWWDSYKGVCSASTTPESILHYLITYLFLGIIEIFPKLLRK